MLKVRTAVMKGIFERDHIALGQSTRPQNAGQVSTLKFETISPEQRQTWTWTAGAADCMVRSLGYFEPDIPQQMPARGVCHAGSLKSVTRPDFSRRGIMVGGPTEQELPADINDLWTSYLDLNPDQKSDFLRAAAKWQEALLHWRERSTLCFALMVVACEALKPSGSQFKDHNIYHVVEALLGKMYAERLQRPGFRSQDVWSAHLRASGKRPYGAG